MSDKATAIQSKDIMRCVGNKIIVESPGMKGNRYSEFRLDSVRELVNSHFIYLKELKKKDWYRRQHSNEQVNSEIVRQK